jgi:hypothetical protein
MAAAQASDQPIAAGMVRVLYRACSPSVAAFAGTTRSSPWDEFQVAYFTGEANWNYLVAPFLFARLPGKIEAQSRTAGRGSVTARSGDGAS